MKECFRTNLLQWRVSRLQNFVRKGGREGLGRGEKSQEVGAAWTEEVTERICHAQRRAKGTHGSTRPLRHAAAPRTARFQRQTELRWEGACHATRLKEGCVREYALRFRECTKHMSMTENITFKKKKKAERKYIM